MEFETVLLSVKDRVATITLNRPEVLNALNDQLMADILAAVREVGQREDVRVGMVTGNGRAFCAGADLKAEHQHGQSYIKNNQDLALEMFNCPKPLIAAVNGYALGGGLEIALCCDIILAAPQAQFGFPEVSVGMLHTTGVTFLLPRMIGLARAKELALTARRFPASEALQLGMINRIVEDGDVLKAAQETADVLLKWSPTAIRLAKRLFNLGASADLTSALTFEAEGLTACIAGNDREEGRRAFAEKRDPEFKEK